jgi:hypothetical protein
VSGRRRLVRAARSVADPPTELLPYVPLGPVPRCACGRPTEAAWCCWVCRAASDGGWPLGPWRPGWHWTATHTWACEQRQLRYAALAWRSPL